MHFHPIWNISLLNLAFDKQISVNNVMFSVEKILPER